MREKHSNENDFEQHFHTDQSELFSAAEKKESISYQAQCKIPSSHFTGTPEWHMAHMKGFGKVCGSLITGEFSGWI